MADEQDRLAFFLEFLEFSIAFCLEKYVANRKRLIDDQDFRVDIDGNCKCQSDKHPAGIGLYRLVHIVPDIRKIQDILQLFINFFFRKTDHRSIQINIFDAVVFHVKACAQLQQGGNSAVYLHNAARLM